jgi:riboflavin transporter FmnP
VTDDEQAQITGFSSGAGVAVAVSAGLAAERLTLGSEGAALIANALSTIAAVVVFALAVRSQRFATRSLMVVPQIAGVLLGTLSVHTWLILTSTTSHPWLTEGPRQLVNDFVASYSIVLMAWACVREKATAGILAVAVLLASYRATTSFWHLDSVLFHTVTVQQLVFAETLAAAVAIVIFRMISAPEAKVR